MNKGFITTNIKNGVEVITDDEMKSQLVDVERNNEKVTVVKLIFEEKVLNVINTYAPQVGSEKKTRECLGERWMW